MKTILSTILLTALTLSTSLASAAAITETSKYIDLMIPVSDTTTNANLGDGVLLTIKDKSASNPCIYHKIAFRNSSGVVQEASKAMYSLIQTAFMMGKPINFWIDTNGCVIYQISVSA